MRKYFKIVFIVSLILTIGVSACKDEKKIPTKKELTTKVKTKKITTKTKPKVKPLPKKKLEQIPNKYFLITASFKNPYYADRLQQKLTKEGYNSKVFNAPNNFHRVSYKAFSDRKQAFKELKSVRATEETKENWLYIKQ